MSMLCQRRAFAAFNDLKPGGASLRTAGVLHSEEFFGSRVPAKPAADAPLHSTSVTARTLGQRVIQLLELRQQTLALQLEHGRLLLPACTTAAEDELFACPAIGMSYQLDFDPRLNLVPILFLEQLLLKALELRLGRTNHVPRLTGP